MPGDQIVIFYDLDDFSGNGRPQGVILVGLNVTEAGIFKLRCRLAADGSRAYRVNAAQALADGASMSGTIS